MSNLTDFMFQIKDWANRQDWADVTVFNFINMAEEKLNAELRIDRMIQFDEAVIIDRCAPLPDDWLAMDLVRVANSAGADGFLTARYKARDEFFNQRDSYTWMYYTLQGRQMFFGGTPDPVNGTAYKISYYGEVPDFLLDDSSWVYQKYGTLYLYATLMHADLHAVGEEDKAANLKQLCEDMIQKLNTAHLGAKASGSRVTTPRRRSFG